MKFHWDLTQAEPIIRDCPVAGTSDILRGAAVALEGAITTAENRWALTNANPAEMSNVVGVSNELYDYSVHINNIGTNAASAAATGICNYIKVCINPTAIYLAEWSQHADNDTVNTAASSTGKIITATFTTDREGDWVYVTNVGSQTGGKGNLFMIGLSTSTTSVDAATLFDDYLKPVNTADTFIVVYNPYSALAAGGSIDLSAATTDAGTTLKGAAATGAGALVVLQSYVTDKATPMEVLRVERHSGKNYDSATCKLFSDVQFSDHLLLGASVSDRIIS